MCKSSPVHVRNRKWNDIGTPDEGMGYLEHALFLTKIFIKFDSLRHKILFYDKVTSKRCGAFFKHAAEVKKKRGEMAEGNLAFCPPPQRKALRKGV